MPVRLVSHEELPGPLKGYRLIERLGRGGFGEVWKVEAPGGIHKAMKFVFGDLDAVDEDESRAAEQELKALNRVKTIRHPYILSLERFDRIDGQLIIVMELADRNLWDRFRECRGQNLVGIPREELLRYLEEAAEALDLMNDHYQIQHLDVKPQNLFLVYNHIKVADFGLAKTFEGARGTITGGVTPVYAGPETFEGYVSRFTDQYSLAICFQELLTGRRPFDGANTKQLLMQHLNGVPDLSSLPAADRSIIGRALSKKPDDRWPSCSEMLRALRAAGSTTETPSPNDHHKTDTPLPQKPLIAAGKAAVTVPGPRVPISPPPAAPTKPTSGSGVVTAVVRPLLVTPGMSGTTPSAARLVTPQGAMGHLPMPAMTIPAAERTAQTGRMSALGIAPPEREGTGALMPAIIVGIGATGLAVLKSFRRSIREKFGAADFLPFIRFLYIDTDPETASAATTGVDGLSGKEVVLLKLNRPTHYLQQNATPNIENWLPQGLLYQLPKNASAANGVRAFGRLALCDQFRMVAQRVRQELEAFVTDDALDKFAGSTGLGLRSNRARAYVVASTAGGTGSGMALDMAYILKNELRSIGYRKPEMYGILLAPPADSTSPKNLALANTHATLAELNHFALGVRYQTKFDNNEPAITDSDGPFSRCAMIPLPKVPKPKDQEEAYTLAARGMFTDLLTPAGRTTDYIRSVTPVVGNPVTPVMQSYGLYRLTWPRDEMLTVATNLLSRQLLSRWAGKEGTHLREPLTVWLEDLWEKQKLDLPTLMTNFHTSATEALRETPEAVFSAAVDTLRTRTPGASRMDASVACTVLDQLLQLVGKPTPDQEVEPSLVTLMNESAKKRITLAEADLSALAVTFIEQPQYRLAGAEEALSQLEQRLKFSLEHIAKQAHELNRDVTQIYTKLFQLLAGLSQTGGINALSGRKASLTNDLYDHLQLYPTRKLQLIELSAAESIYRGLLGMIPEHIRDVNFCRSRLNEIRGMVPEPPKASAKFFGGQLILPKGCTSIPAAAELIIDALPPDDILAYDQSFQKELTKKFRGLANLCLKADRTPEFLTFLNAQTREFLNARLEKNDPATMLLRYHGNTADTAQMLRHAFEESAPGITTLSGERPLEATVLALPAGAASEQLKLLLHAATDDVEFIPANLPDDIAIYRELPRLEIAALPQSASHAREAYDALATRENPLHTRADIRWTALKPR
jgi:eukaryotic-like serine/threonine-protein kinase